MVVSGFDCHSHLLFRVSFGGGGGGGSGGLASVQGLPVLSSALPCGAAASSDTVDPAHSTT